MKPAVSSSWQILALAVSRLGHGCCASLDARYADVSLSRYHLGTASLSGNIDGSTTADMDGEADRPRR